ncbi:MAG: glycosyltransferase [Acetobacteraceae bacterium]|nr:glycosyltransferase [Acetobacteraceae bacterium]
MDNPNPELLLSLAWLGFVIWLILRALRQRAALSELSAHQKDSELQAVCFLVPARDEEENIERCVRSLLVQDFPRERLSVVVVDDGSTDRTAAIVRAIAEEDDRLRLVHASALPPGWKGKVNACCAGVDAAPEAVEWLCFIDADVWANPLLARCAVNSAIHCQADLLSLAPKHQLKSMAERLVIPCGFYVLAFTHDLSQAQEPKSRDATVTGQFMLIRRHAYNAVGGHAAVKTAICEDVELARLMKRRGHRVLLLDGGRLLNTRMYNGWRTLWPGFAKNLTEMLGGPALTILIVALAVSMAAASVLLPAFDVLGCVNGSKEGCVALLPAFIGSAALVALHIAGAVHFEIPFWYGFLFPAGYLAAALIGLDSLRWRARRRIVWKGRVYR